MAGYTYRQPRIDQAIEPYREYNTDHWEVVPKITLYKKTISHLLRQVAYLSHRAAKLEAERSAATISTKEELEALPVGSIIHLPDARNCASKDDEGTWALGGHPDPWPSRRIAMGLHGGHAVVLHRGQP